VVELVLTFLANSLVQSTLVCAAALAASRALRSAPAATRFALLAVSLAVAVVAPSMSLLPRAASMAPPSSAAAPQVNERGAIAITIVYLLGAAAAAIRLALAWRRARRLVARSRPFSGNVRLSDEIATASTVGATILIPPALAASDLLGSALGHEAAHVRRRDFAVNALLELAALPLWFHPAVHLLRRELRVLREIACDDEATRRCPRREYAAALVRLAALASARERVALAIGTTAIERRVALLRRPPAHPNRAAAIATLALPALLLAACTRVSISPEVRHASLCGLWKLVPGKSDFRALRPSAFDDYTQSIVQGPRGVRVAQHRVANGLVRDERWSVVTDGRWRALDGIRGAVGKAEWRDGRLALTMQGPGTHREDAVAYVDGDHLICEGTSDRAHFRGVFRRID